MKSRFLMLIVGALAIGAAHASIKNTDVTKINKVYAYDDYGSLENGEGADVTIWMDTGVAECPQGVWLSPNAPGYQTLVSFVLGVYMADKTVRFQIYSDRIWGGSSQSKLCQVDAVRLD